MCISFHIWIFWLGFPPPHSHYTIPSRINSFFCTMCLLLYLYTMHVSAQSSFQTRTGLFQVHCHTTPAAHSWTGQSCNSKVVVYADTVKKKKSIPCAKQVPQVWVHSCCHGWVHSGDFCSPTAINISHSHWHFWLLELECQQKFLKEIQHPSFMIKNATPQIFRLFDAPSLKLQLDRSTCNMVYIIYK